ncbi:MAG: MBL fold metallo-hydrolase [candidate division WOR-3 bacterium]
MKLGSFQLIPLSDGFFGLDGGAMFGVVPKPLWEKTNPPDERNRIRLALRPLLVVTSQYRILFDTGIGDKENAKFQDIYRIEKSDTIDASLARAGFRPEEVTHVVLTHLHFDHCGGTTRLDSTGRPVLRFPNARHFVQRLEWDDATHPNRRTRATYLPDNFLPIEEAGQLELIEGNLELLPGIELVRTGGHTRGMQIGFIRAEGKTAVFWSDMIPTRSHIAIPYIMGYDLFPLETMELKERLVGQACDERWISFLEHDPEVTCGIIRRENDRFAFEPIPEERRL